VIDQIARNERTPDLDEAAKAGSETECKHIVSSSDDPNWMLEHRVIITAIWSTKT